MLWEKIGRFWKAGLEETLKDTLMSCGNKEETPSGHTSMPFGNKEEMNKILSLFVVTGTVILVMAGCGGGSPKVSEFREIVEDNEMHTSSEDDSCGAENIAEVYRDIYNEAAETPFGHTSMPYGNKVEIKRRIVARLGENGYVAVDSENQVDMTGAGQVLEFCKAVEEKKDAAVTIVVITDFGFRKFDLETENGSVNIVRGYYQYDQNGNIQNRSTVSYPANFAQYTEEGYLLFEGSYFSDENFALTLSDTTEHTALRILPLNETCRELNRKYILPVGYEQNNIFLTDWSEENFGDLDFYDVFDIFYPVLYGQPVPYVADENLGVGAVYRIPEEIFENVVMTYMDIDKETLRQKTAYLSEEAAYEYRPRGFYEVEYPDIPYPEVVDYTENPDGTITLIINAVYPSGNTSLAYSHKTVIRPLDGDGFQYISNEIISTVLPNGMKGCPEGVSTVLPNGMEGYPEGVSLEDERDIWWHSNRLTEEEWEEVYGGNAQ